MQKTLKLLVLGLTLLSVTSCATIVDGGDKFVSVNVDPANSKIHVRSNQGEEYVRQGSFNLRVDRKASYTLVVESPNYISEEITVKRGLNGWYFGNILFGGIIGLIVDGVTGNMWTPKPKIVSVKMVKDDGKGPSKASADRYPDEVVIELPIQLQMEDGTTKVVMVPVKFMQKATAAEIA